MTAYYNEIDEAAAWALNQLIADGVIAPGIVDTRSIKEVSPDDLRGFTQCHFFAGAGLWSVAARLAGWPDDKSLWSGSCPCQPFSQAGKRAGTDDPRHLWPDFFRLIRACRPDAVVGEQVAGSAGRGWLAGVRADLESGGYAFGAVDIPAGAIGAPHERNRHYWIAVAQPAGGAEQGRCVQRPGEGYREDGERAYGQLGRPDCGELADSLRTGRDATSQAGIYRCEESAGARHGEPERLSGFVPLGDAFGSRLEGHPGDDDGETGRPEPDRPTTAANGGAMVDAARLGWREGSAEPEFQRWWSTVAGSALSGIDVADADKPVLQRKPPAGQQPEHEQNAGTGGRNAPDNYWSDAGWIGCHDGKARRAKPGIRLLADGFPGRIDTWRIAGNAIVPALAAEVLKAYLETESMIGSRQ